MGSILKNSSIPYLSILFSLFLIVYLIPSQSVRAASSFPDGFHETLVANGIHLPTTMAFAPDGRLFVSEKSGSVRVIKNGVLLPDPFLTVKVNEYIERGLVGIAFDPNFETNRFVYIYYTRAQEPIKNRLSRFTASNTNPDVAEPNSEQILLDNIGSDSGMHNGGALHFGPDGKLYVSVGDGGQDSTNAQDLGTLSGKILRLNTDGTIPEDNPFVNQEGARGEIWTYGLRNPFTFAFHPTNGKMYINDVGADLWEEINVGAKGANYGWPVCEGTCSISFFTNPLYSQYHPLAASFTGAEFYTGSVFPAQYKDDYFFGDYAKNYIKLLNSSDDSVADFATGTDSPVDIRMGPDGSLYYASINTGSVYKISYGNAPSSTPLPTPTPAVISTFSNKSPEAIIAEPGVGRVYEAGIVVSFSGSGVDPEDGTLPDSAFSWTIVFHHEGHTHPFEGPITEVKNGEFTIPSIGESSDNVWYRIHLTVTDSQGAQSTVFRDLMPKHSTNTINTDPPGLDFSLDGQPHTSPYTFTGVVGFTRIMDAPLTQIKNGAEYQFVSWSDDGESTHQISTPVNNTKYTATYKKITSHGLRGEYFDNMDLTALKLTRVDPQLNFSWGLDAPDPSLYKDTFSVRWNGFIAPPETGEYTFYSRSDDGIRLWINNTLVIDNWTDHSPTENSGTLTLQAGQKYPIKVEYYENTVESVMQLSWSSPSFSKQVISENALYLE